MSSGTSIESMLPVRAKNPRPSNPGRGRRTVLLALALTFLAVSAVLLLTNLIVLFKADGEIYSSPEEARRAEVAIVPGALVNSDGTMSLMLADRVNQAAALYKQGKVEKILVSGDHGRWAYDEPTTMRRALIEAGIPAERIFTDHAGFNTNATMQRARDIFGITDAIVVTQDFHLKRSLYLADAAGINADGLQADLHGYGPQGLKSDLREVGSRTKAVIDLLRGAPVLGGEPVPIDGPARDSWGPNAPAGTPPAGAPSD